MTMFNDILAADVQNAFLGEFSETVRYTPLHPSETNQPRDIQALVQRDPPAPLSGFPGWVAPKLSIRVANHATLGIASSQLNTGGDTVTVAERVGATAKRFQVRLPQGGESHDPAMLVLELR